MFRLTQEIKEGIEVSFSALVEKYLDDNANEIFESEPYGDTSAMRSVGYSSEDVLEAKRDALHKMKEDFEEYNNGDWIDSDKIVDGEEYEAAQEKILNFIETLI